MEVHIHGHDGLEEPFQTLITMTIHKKESEENVVFDILQFSFKS
jgi:hypothetical protein